MGTSRQKSGIAFLTRSTHEPGDSRHRFEVGARCRRCTHEEWHPAQNAGWGQRIFKKKGWLIGRDSDHHVCPTCARGPRRDMSRAARQLSAIGATVHEFPTQSASLGPTAEISSEAEIIALPAAEPGAPPEPKPQEVDMAPTALAEALAPVRAEIEKHQIVKGSRGKPTGYKNEASADASATYFCRQHLRIARPHKNQHFKTEVDPTAPGTWRYVLLGDYANEPPRPIRVLRRKEGEPQMQRGRTVRAGQLACERAGIATPIENVHFEVYKIAGQVWAYRLLPAARVHQAEEDNGFLPRISGGGHLSYFDAKKSALAALQPRRKDGGAPKEGVDYWVAQDGYNLWSWSTTPPASLQQVGQIDLGALPQVAERKEPASDVSEVHPTISDNRRIMEALDQRYDVGKQRYRGAWSDLTLASTLALPDSWIAKVRDQFYGPDRNDTARIEQVEAAVAKGESAIKAAEQIVEVAADLTTVIAELKGLLAEMK